MKLLDFAQKTASVIGSIWNGKPENYYHPFSSSSYTGGSYRSGGAKWQGGLTGDGNGIDIDHYRTRQNARKAFHESNAARSLVMRTADTVVDNGLRLEPDPVANILGITMEEAESWSSDVAERFHLWASSKNSDYTRINNFYQNQRLYQISAFRDNDVFARLYYTKEAGTTNPLQIQFIDPNQIRGDGFTNTYGLNSSIINSNDGIIRDEKGREVGYKVFIQKQDGSIESVDVPRIGARSGRVMMIHGFKPEYAGQARGFSELHHALQDLQNLGDFTSSQIMKAINQSMITMTVESDNENPAVNPMVGMSRLPAGPNITPTTGTGTSTVEAESEISPYYTPIPDAENRVPGSTAIFGLEGQQRLKPFMNTAPSDTFGTFVDAFLTNLAASKSMPVEVLQMKFGNSYSASRGALLLYWRVAQIMRDDIASDFNNIVYEMWLAGEIAAGRIKAPGWSNPILKAAWLNCNWIGAPMPNIDPMRTANAEKVYLDIGYTNQERGAKNHNGSSAKVNIAKNAKLFSQTPVGPWNVKQGGPAGG